MKARLVLIAGLASFALAGPVAAADLSGRWIVSGKVSSFAFTVNCAFQQAGAGLKGVCVDGATSDPKITGGHAHVITAGRVDGDKVTWTYGSSFLLSHFKVIYRGVRRGDHMTGTITVQGRTGAFTANRAG